MSIRVLHCIPGMGGGGAERQLAYLAAELKRTGCDVHVALLSEGPNYERLRSSGAANHRLKALGNHDPSILWQLIRTIRAIRPQLVQVWILQMEVLGGLAATLTGTPWIFTERSSEMAYPRTLKHRLRVAVASRASAVVSNSAGGDEYWARRLDAEAQRYIVPNAVPAREIACAPVADSRELNVPPEDRVILFAGRFSAEKNIASLVHALAPMLRRPHVRAVLVGEGPRRPAIEQLVSALGLSSRIIVPGFLTNVWSWMKRSAVFVSPAVFEGHPNTVIEAMASGCPLVVSDIPAHREFLTADSALFVAPDNVAALTAAIDAVLSDAGAASRRASVAKQKTEEWSVETIARRWVCIYDEVLSAPSAHRRGQA